MTLINKIHRIVNELRGCTFSIFWLMYAVGSREHQGASPPGPPPGLCPRSAGELKASPQIPSCRGVIACCASSTTFIPHVIYKQQTQGKHIDFDEKTQGKMGGNHKKLRENDADNSVRTLQYI